MYFSDDMRPVNSQKLMGQVLTKLCTQRGLAWNSAASGDEVFVTLSRQGVVAAMAPSVGPFSTVFKRQPGTIAVVYRDLTRENVEGLLMDL